jgi:hypothetical protein
MRLLEFPDKTIGDDEDALEEEEEEEEEEEATNNNRYGRNIYRRTIMHCVGKVPRGYDWLHVLQ